MAPIDRTTARVVPVSADGRVLLLQDQDPARPGILRWGTIGGAVEPGESLVDGVLRELYEETGIVATSHEVTEPLCEGTHEFSYAGVVYRSRSTFFAMPLRLDVTVSFAHLEPDEIGNVLSSRWWTPDDLEREGDLVVPDLIDVLRLAVATVSPTSGAT